MKNIPSERRFGQLSSYIIGTIRRALSCTATRIYIYIYLYTRKTVPPTTEYSQGKILENVGSSQVKGVNLAIRLNAIYEHAAIEQGSTG